MKKVTKLWTQKDRTRIRICDMTDSHIKNCINMLTNAYNKTIEEGLQYQGTIETALPVIKELRKELQYRREAKVLEIKKKNEPKVNEVIADAILSQLRDCLTWEPNYEECGPQFANYDYAKAKKLYKELQKMGIAHRFETPEHFEDELSGKNKRNSDHNNWVPDFDNDDGADW